MNVVRFLCRVASIALLVGCGDDDLGDVSPADASSDTARPDSRLPDAGEPDTTVDGSADLGAVDATPPDATSPDASPPDATADAGGAGCTGTGGAGDRDFSISAGRRTRTFQVHLPPAYDGSTPLPVVLNYHGRNSTASQQRLVSRMDATADAQGFIVVYPQGVGQTWNGGFCCGEAMSADVDDVAFTSAMIDELNAQLCVDNRRVYATGLSNGGFMAHRLGCDLSDRIAAIAPVAGTNLTSSCSPSRAVPVLHFHGDADGVVFYDGFGGFASVDDTMSGWASRNGCGGSSSVDLDEGDVRCESWSGCDDGGAVRLCTIEGGGHQWPGGATIPGLGHNTTDISATETMWTFFSAHSL